MRRTRGLLAATLIGSAVGCHHQPGSDSEPTLTSTALRAGRRAYDGAPPVIPHALLGGACSSCHSATGRALPGLGVAPASPHGKTVGIGTDANCRQCHVFKTTGDIFVRSDFVGRSQAVRSSDRRYPGAPPVTPHDTFAREDCVACHAGLAARPEIVCDHAERLNCAQCHARGGARAEPFVSSFDPSDQASSAPGGR
jgi:cytochrome c-type protein NapB